MNEITADRRNEMFALMTRYYDNVRPSEFESDLSKKDWVIEIADRWTGRLRGFSTQTVVPVEVGDRKIFALFSGDTIVEQSYRQNNPLAGLWGRLVLQLADWIAPHEFYWFLISKGVKTYRFLPLFFREFHPRFDARIPRDASDVITTFARRLFPDTFDPTTGLIRASADGCRLRADEANAPPRRRDPHAQFFQHRNPRHAHGDELCCVAPLDRDNFTPTAWRVIQSVPEQPQTAVANIDAVCDARIPRSPVPIS